jgi:acyl-CoA reductase-like NAD-dependent aldehyde dehydrogenase
MIRPALAALAAGNTCILKVHQELSATSPLLS